jgi:hypothetical protein
LQPPTESCLIFDQTSKHIISDQLLSVKQLNLGRGLLLTLPSPRLGNRLKSFVASSSSTDFFAKPLPSLRESEQLCCRIHQKGQVFNSNCWLLTQRSRSLMMKSYLINRYGTTLPFIPLPARPPPGLFHDQALRWTSNPPSKALRRTTHCQQQHPPQPCDCIRHSVHWPDGRCVGKSSAV